MKKAESSERIKRALQRNVRIYCEENYQNGDKVFYKRRAVKGCKDSATLLGKEGNFVLTRHGSAFYRCHPCHLIKATQQKSPKTPDFKPVSKTIDVFQERFTKKTNIQVLILLNMTMIMKKKTLQIWK